MGREPNQKPNIVKLFSASQDDQSKLKEEDLENFAKSLLIFGRNSDNYSSESRSCQVASLADLKTGPILKVKQEKPEKNAQVIKLGKTD